MSPSTAPAAVGSADARGASAAAVAAGRPIRVAAVMDTAIVSGPGRQLAALAAALRAVGVELTIVVFQHTGAPKTAYREFLEHAGLPHEVVPFASRFDRALLPALRATLDRLAPDVVQTHSYRPTVLAWLLRRRGARWRWLGFHHGTTNEDLKVRLYHWLDHQLLPSSDCVVVMSREQADRFGGPGPRVRQLYNAVLPIPASRTSAESAALLERVARLPRPRVGVIGRLSHEKGVDVALRAARLLQERGQPVSLVLAGDGPERASATALATSLGLADTAHFLGPVLPVEPLYPLLDLVLIPSRSEGLPNVLLEALRADRPVVSTRVGAVSEVLDERALADGAGWTAPPESPEALADAVASALDAAADPVRASALGAARAAVARRFSLDARVAAHVALYREVLADARSRR